MPLQIVLVLGKNKPFSLFNLYLQTTMSFSVLYKYKLKVLEVIYNICVCIASCLYTRYRTHTTHFVNSTYNIVFLIYICFKDIQTSWISSMYVACTNQYPTNQYSLCYLSPESSMLRVYHQRSESCGFDSRQGLRNVLIGLK